MTQEQILEKFKKAIDGKLATIFLYQGLEREALPFMLGETTEGRLVLQAYQNGGFSSKGPVTKASAGFKFFYLDQVDEGPAVASFTNPSSWPLQKAEGEYQAPKFIARVLALVKL